MSKKVQIRFTEETKFHGHVEHPDTLMKVTEEEAMNLFRLGVAVPHGVGGVIAGRAVHADMKFRTI